MKARIHITLKKSVFDPQGRAIASALRNLGYSDITDVRQGKYIELDLNEEDTRKACECVENMCRDLLANTITENYTVDIEQTAPETGTWFSDKIT